MIKRIAGVIGLLSFAAVGGSMGAPAAFPTQMALNEAKAIGTLRTLISGQEKFRTALCIDEDQDLVGEYGSIGELSGVCWLMRHFVGVGWPLYPPLLPAAFQAIDANGYAKSSGYYFVIFLPNNVVSPTGQRDVAFGGPAPSVDPNHCEQLWCAYAWPVSVNTTGTRAFFVNQAGVVLETSMNCCQYSGAAAPPLYAAAFSAYGMNQPVATPPVVGVDCNDWIPVP